MKNVLRITSNPIYRVKAYLSETIFRMKYLSFLLIMAMLSGCAIISKQYYYEPSVPHQKLKSRYPHADYKMVYSKVPIVRGGGDSVGSVTTSNGIGHPLLMGPFLPVIPVGGFFLKSSSHFVMDITINCADGYFMALAIDSNDYKHKRDSLNGLKIYRVQQLNTDRCFMIVNDTAKIPLYAEEFFMGNLKSHSYRLYCDMRFRKIKTMRLVTGNAILDSTLKNITFKRKSRIKFDLIGPGY